MNIEKTSAYRNEIIIFSLDVGLRLIACFLVAFFPVWVPAESLPLIPIVGSDSIDYLSAAQSILETGHFLNPAGAPNSFELPGYPLLLAGAIAVFSTIFVVPFLQHIIAGISALLLYRIGLVFSKKIAWGAALLFIFDPAGILYTNTILTEPLFIFFVLLAFWIIVTKAAHILPTLISGIVLGAATMVRPVGEILVPSFLVFIGARLWPMKKKIIAYTLLFFTGFLLMIGPWLVRNKILFDRFELSAVASWQFAYAHTPLFYARLHGISDRKAVKIFHERVFTASPYKEDVRAGHTGTLRNAPYMWQVAREEIKAHPFQFALFYVSRSARFFISDGLRDIGQRIALIKEPLANLGDLIFKGDLKSFAGAVAQNRIVLLFFIVGFASWSLIVLAMITGVLFGIVREERTKKFVLIASFLMVIIMALVAGGAVAHPRYRFSVSSFMFLLASYGFFAALDKIKQISY